MNSVLCVYLRRCCDVHHMTYPAICPAHKQDNARPIETKLQMELTNKPYTLLDLISLDNTVDEMDFEIEELEHF
jgi:hypothetical protein